MMMMMMTRRSKVKRARSSSSRKRGRGALVWPVRQTCLLSASSVSSSTRAQGRRGSDGNKNALVQGGEQQEEEGVGGVGGSGV
jgi:hypothetical protein